MLAPLAGAQKDAFDPLVLEMTRYPTADGALAREAPPDGSIPLPMSTPAAPGDALRFTLASPIRFQPGAALAVTLTLRADAPVLTGDGLEVAIEGGGAPQTIALPPAMAPGSVTSVAVNVIGASGYDKGSPITLVVRARAPALAENALSLVLGEAASSVVVHEMRVPSLADLELNVLPMFALEAGDIPAEVGSAINDYVVTHESITPPAAPALGTDRTRIVLRGAEPSADARTHAIPEKEERLAAAHVFTVNGKVARVHPGIGVVVTLSGGPIVVRCVQNCPAGGFTHTIAANGTATSGADRPSALVPPPRDTRGIPVSEDAATGKQVPLPAALVLVAIALAARRRIAG